MKRDSEDAAAVHEMERAIWDDTGFAPPEPIDVPTWAGTTRVYQVYQRDSDPAFCPSPAGSTFNVSNGYRIAW